MDKAFEALEVATQMVEDARPLLNQAIELVDEASIERLACTALSVQKFTDAARHERQPCFDVTAAQIKKLDAGILAVSGPRANRWLYWLQVTPLLAELRAGNLVGNLEALTRSAAEAAEDIHRLQSEVRHCWRPAVLLA